MNASGVKQSESAISSIESYESLVGRDANGDNTLNGTGQSDTLYGQDGINSVLYGNGGNDILIGGSAQDLISGGAGADTLTGNAGADLFTYTNPATDFATAGMDIITDFSGNGVIMSAAPTSDLAYLDGDVLVFDLATLNIGNGTGLLAGATLDDGLYYTLSSTGLISEANAVATAGHAQFLYNTTTKVLSFDADGTGAGQAVEIATLTGVTSLAETNIVVMG